MARHDWDALDPKIRALAETGKTRPEIAEALGVPLQTLHARLLKLGVRTRGRERNGKAVKALTAFAPPVGRMPALNYLPPSELAVDAGYQRSIEARDSQRLIVRIARGWDWAKCLPLLVSDRGEDGMFVIDGQHRLAAARLRGDIAQLPCVVVKVDGPEGEAALFDAVNTQRRPLTPLELFRAALAAGDAETWAILTALDEAGLTLAPHSNHSVWKPGMIGNIGSIRAAWRRDGPGATAGALALVSKAFAGQVLVYAGTIFPGIPPLVAKGHARALAGLLASRSQDDWRKAVMRELADHPRFNRRTAAESVLAAALRHAAGVDAARFAEGKAWCDQCEMQVTIAEASGCKSRYCSLKASSVAATGRKDAA